MKSKTLNMTTGNPLKNMILFAVPVMFSHLVQQFYNIADTYIVGRYISSDALAAVGSVGPMSGLLLGLAFGVTGGFSIPVAQSFGAGNKKLTNHYVGNAVTLTVIISTIITTASMFLIEPVLKMLDTPAEILDDAKKYAVIIFGGSIFNVIYNILAGVLRAMGDSKAPLRFLIVTSVLNVFLNYISIVTFDMGVSGAALATILCQLVSCIMCIIYIGHRKEMLQLSFKDFKLSKTTTVLMLKMGVPMALQFSITSIGSMVLQGTLNGYGADVIAGWSVANKPEQIANIPLSATGIACATFTGQNFGAKKYERVKQGVKSAMIFSGVMSVASSIILYFFGGEICRIFFEETNTVALDAAQTYLRIIALFYFALAVLFVFRNALQGVGKTYASVIAGVSELGGRIVAALIMSKFFGFAGICLASPCAWIFADIPLVLLFYFKVLRKKENV